MTYELVYYSIISTSERTIYFLYITRRRVLYVTVSIIILSKENSKSSHCKCILKSYTVKKPFRAQSSSRQNTMRVYTCLLRVEDVTGS